MDPIKNLRTKYQSIGLFIDFLCGVLASFALPPLFVLPLLFFLGIPVWRVIHASNRTKAAGILGITGFGWFLASTFWVSHALIVDTSSLWMLTPFVAMGLAALLASFWAAAGAICWIKETSKLVRLLCLVVAFSAFEWSRSFVASGFPWSLMGSVFAIHTSSLQMASAIGVYGLTLMAFGIAIAPLLWFLSCRHLAIFFLLMPLIGSCWGAFRVNANSEEIVENAPRVRLVQPAVLQKDKWNRQKREDHLSDLIKLSRDGTSIPKLVIWPETAFAGLPSNNRKLLLNTVQAATQSNGFLLTGIPRLTGNGRPLNSAFLFDNQGNVREIYDKRHLVPFGEYVPFRSWLPFLDFIAGSVDFVAGTNNRVMMVPQLGQIQTLICYEVIFSGRIVSSSNRPDIIVNLTNDAWFGRTIGPWQHLYQARMRAVEEGIPLLRVANTGISAAFDGFGNGLGVIPLGEQGYLDIAVPSVLTAPIFARYGNALFFVMCLGVFGVACYLHFHRDRALRHCEKK